MSDTFKLKEFIMKITRTSPFSNLTNVMDINVTEEQLALWESGTLIQNAMPNLSADEREFIKTARRLSRPSHQTGGIQLMKLYIVILAMKMA